MKSNLERDFLNKFTYLAGDGIRLEPQAGTWEAIVKWVDKFFLPRDDKFAIEDGVYSIREDGEPNTYTIMKDNWVMVVKFNGEFPVEEQRKKLERICRSLSIISK